MQFPAEEFRTPANIMLPDIRNDNFEPDGISKFHSYIQEYRIENNVPENIIIQFDTVKNLFLHSYYVYRFFRLLSINFMSY